MALQSVQHFCFSDIRYEFCSESNWVALLPTQLFKKFGDSKIKNKMLLWEKSLLTKAAIIWSKQQNNVTI